MHLWIDNTGLHGAGRCLVGEARTGYDIKGLLQLATLIVFADTMELGDFEPPMISETSADFRKMILGIGVDGTALSICHKSREEYALACRAAADFAADELLFQFRADEQLILGLPETNLPRGAQFRAERTEWLASELSDPAELEKINESALDTQAGGAIDYMLSGSLQLRQAVSQLMNEEPAWSPGHTFQVESMLRAYLNDHLAQQVDATYTPAAHRADLVFRQNQWVVDQLNDALQPIVNELRPQPLGIPSVNEALIRRSRGDPRGLLSEALKLRARAGELRSSLFLLQQAQASGDPALQHQVKKEVEDLARGVRIDLGLESPWDAVTIQFSFGLPPVKVSVPSKAIADWAKFRRNKGKRAVLTDVVRAAAFSGVDDGAYRKLVTRSIARDVAVESISLPRLH